MVSFRPSIFHFRLTSESRDMVPRIYNERETQPADQLINYRQLLPNVIEVLGMGWSGTYFSRPE